MPKKKKKQKPSFKQRQTQKVRKRNINLKKSEAVRGAVASAISKVKMSRDEKDKATADEIRGYSLEIRATLTEMEDSLKKFTPAPAVAEVQAKPGLSMTVSEAAGEARKKGFDFLTSLLPIIGLLGVLISDKARAFLTGFFEGLLTSLGLTKEQIEKMKQYAVVAIAVLGAYFTVKALQSAGDLFNAVINLAKVTMGMLIASDTEVDRSMSEARKRKAEREKLLKKAKEQKAKARLERMRNRRKGAGNFAKKIFGKIGRGVLSALPLVGTAVVVAFTVWDIAEELNEFYKDQYEEYDLLTDEDIDVLKKEGWTDKEIVQEQQRIMANRARVAEGLQRAQAEPEMTEAQAQIIAASSDGMRTTEDVLSESRDSRANRIQEGKEISERFNIRPEEAKNNRTGFLGTPFFRDTSNIKINNGTQLQQLQQSVNAAEEAARKKAEEDANLMLINNTNIFYAP